MGKYNVQGQLYAQGKYMTAYEAVQEGLGKKVEIRILAQRAAEGSVELSRFQAQIKNLATLDHPSILRVLDCGVANGKLYYVTELKKRVTIGELMAQLPPPPVDERLKIAVQVASAVKYMHSKGVIHRGIDETSVNYDPEVQLAYVSQFSFIKNAKKDNLTARGIGTVFQLLTTPEGAMGQALDERSDVFLLGVLLFKMLTGQEPFSPKAFLGLTPESAERIEPKKLTELDAQASEALGAALSKACAVVPEKRFQSAAELETALVEAQKKLKLKRPEKKADSIGADTTATDGLPLTADARKGPGSSRSARKALVRPAAGTSSPANPTLATPGDSPADPSAAPSAASAPQTPKEQVLALIARIKEDPKGQAMALIARIKEDPQKQKIAIGVAALALLSFLGTLALLLRI